MIVFTCYRRFLLPLLTIVVLCGVTRSLGMRIGVPTCSALRHVLQIIDFSLNCLLKRRLVLPHFGRKKSSELLVRRILVRRRLHTASDGAVFEREFV